MLTVISNRLKHQSVEIIAEEQAGLKAGRRTTKQILNLRILCTHVKSTSSISRICTMSSLISKNLLQSLACSVMGHRAEVQFQCQSSSHYWAALGYDKATTAVQVNGSIGGWFRTTVGVRQGCLLSPTLFNIFLEQIMFDALEEHVGKVSIGGRNITNLRFADDIDALAEEKQELEALAESLDKTCTRYKIEISAEKTKQMTNSVNGIRREINVKGQKLGTVTS